MRIVSTEDELNNWLNEGASEMAAFIALDLGARAGEFAQFSLAGSKFLGCTLNEELVVQIWRQHGSIFNEVGVLPERLPAFSRGIYTVAELYDGLKDDGSDWDKTPDHDGFRWFMSSANNPRQLDVVEMLAARMHDTIQEREVVSFLENRKVVAIMGGHDFPREQTADEIRAGKPEVYWKCVKIAKRLAEEGFLILSGGGPGVMEAANLGALLAGADETKVATVRGIMKQHPFTSAEWRATALLARREILGNAEPTGHQVNLGIPTWYYGHEPPNLFASHHAKMFYNSLREDGLVTWANSGIIYFEGNGGTVQEIFQDAAQNYYSTRHTPMVLFGKGYWNRPANDVYDRKDETKDPKDKRKPLLPLLQQLSREKDFERSLLVTESAADTVTFILERANA